jgi:hypothetical protein
MYQNPRAIIKENPSTSGKTNARYHFRPIPITCTPSSPSNCISPLPPHHHLILLPNPPRNSFPFSASPFSAGAFPSPTATSYLFSRFAASISSLLGVNTFAAPPRPTCVEFVLSLLGCLSSATRSAFPSYSIPLAITISTSRAPRTQ